MLFILAGLLLKNIDYIGNNMYNIAMSKKVNKYPYNVLLRRPKPSATQLPYRVHSVGRICQQPYHITLGTYYDDIMFLFFVSGQGIYKKGGKTIQIKPEMAGFILPSEDPGLLNATPSNPYDHYYCRFAGDYAKQVAKRIADEKGSSQIFFNWPRWKDGIKVLQRMCDLWKYRSKNELREMNLVDAALAELLVLLDCSESPQTPQLMASTLEHYMQSHISEQPSLQDVADYFCVSRYHLCRVAKACLDEPLMKRWERMKINWAITLLHEPTLSIQQIGRHVGYEDPFYFSRVFKNHIGLCPREWRKKHCQPRA